MFETNNIAFNPYDNFIDINYDSYYNYNIQNTDNDFYTKNTKNKELKNFEENNTKNININDKNNNFDTKYKGKTIALVNSKNPWYLNDSDIEYFDDTEEINTNSYVKYDKFVDNKNKQNSYSYQSQIIVLIIIFVIILFIYKNMKKYKKN